MRLTTLKKRDMVMPMEFGKDKLYGMELVLNLRECDHETLSSRDSIIQYAKEICRVIEMKPFGEPWAERFGLNKDFSAGYSLVQLIETSSVTGHFSELWDTAYINIFSCKEFDAEKATAFTKQYFGAKDLNQQVLIR